MTRDWRFQRLHFSDPIFAERSVRRHLPQPAPLSTSTDRALGPLLDGRLRHRWSTPANSTTDPNAKFPLHEHLSLQENRQPQLPEKSQ
ncbi:unnamed protein product [Sphagnum troendelagicum]